MEEIKKIPEEKFNLVQKDDKIFDAKFETKPISYFQDAMIRFKKNQASVIATYIIGAIFLYALIVPFFSSYNLAYSDGVYAKVRPKLGIFKNAGFWDGGRKMKYSDRFLVSTVGIGAAIKNGDGSTPVSWDEAVKASPVMSLGEEFKDAKRTYRYARIDSYQDVGFIFKSMTMEDFNKIKAWEKESGIQVFFPMIDFKSKYAPIDDTDANMWYRVDPDDRKQRPINKEGKRQNLAELKKNGFVDNYLRDKDGNVLYKIDKDKTMVGVRILYSNYYQYVYGHEPGNVFGTDAQGFDIMVRMAHGTRLSLALAICVSVINFMIGALYGAVEGFYGGWVDLLLERVKDVLWEMPFIVVATLFQLHLVQTGKVSVFGGLLFAFILKGWIGPSARVRTQFYRFKKQEYILAAQTLGARDARLMFKHIFPNAIGTIITAFALIIPGTIASEAMLSYLNIVNFQGKELASLGSMLASGQPYLATDPHILLIPSAVISLMMISFNLFGNGLRDAFNPSLRGVED